MKRRATTGDRPERDLVYPPVLVAARAAFFSLGLDFTVSGSENIPREGSALLAINHTGWLDFTFAGYAAHPSRRLVRFMAKQSIFDAPVAGPLMRGMKHIPVDREAGAAAYREAVTVLRQGQIVGVFPETTISRSFELLPFKTGTARMAVSGKAPILPVVIWGSQRVWTAGRRRAVAPYRIPISIDVLPPMTVTRGDDAEEVTAQLRATMEVALHAAQERYPAQPRSEADRWWLPARLGGAAPTPEEAEKIAVRRAAERAARLAAEAPSDQSSTGGPDQG